MSLLWNDNQYIHLEIEENIDDDLIDVLEPQVIPERIQTTKVKHRKWERKLPQEYTLTSTTEDRSLHLPVELETTDTQQVKSAKALLDCGATGLFMSHDFTTQERINTKKFSVPIPVQNVNGSPNEGGPIMEVADIVLWYKGHYECTIFAITKIKQEDIILGLPWLKEHNLEVDWVTEDVKMT